MKKTGRFPAAIHGAGIACLAVFTLALALSGCGGREKITALSQLEGKEFAVPTGTMADQLVLSKFPKAKFVYFNTVLDCALAVKNGKADAAAYDEPILRNIAAKNDGIQVLDEMLTVDNYGIAVQHARPELKAAIDGLLAEMKADGSYEEMRSRWLPASGAPAPMPAIALDGANGTLVLGTAAVTEPFSFVDGSQQVVGLDIEIAQRVAKKLGMKLEVVNMDFGGMIPALVAGKVDMIAACITITEERGQKVLFSEPYYRGGIAALVKK